jgi:hypothetical protein
VADSLHDELLAIPGIDSADFDGGVAAPDGVRVRLSAGADPVRVGEDVRKVLAEHGLRSQMTSPPVAPAVPPLPPTQLEPLVAPEPPPEAHAPVVTMPNVEEPPETLVVETPGPEHMTQPAEGDVAAPPGAPLPEVDGVEPKTEPVPQAPGAVQLGLRSVAVEEARDGLSVVATRTDGLAVQRPARDSTKGLDAAVVAAVAGLTGGAARPRLVGIFDAEAEGVAVVTVVVEVDDGSLRSGSAVVAAGRAYGVARATWRALSAPV